MYDKIKHPKSKGQSKEYHTLITCVMKNGLATFQRNSIYVVDRCTVFFILDQNYYILFLFSQTNYRCKNSSKNASLQDVMTDTL